MPPAPKSRVVLHTMCLCHGKHVAQGRGRRSCRNNRDSVQSDAGRGQGSAGVPLPSTLPTLPSVLWGQETSEYSSGTTRRAKHTSTSFFSFGSTLSHGLKTSHDALAAESPEGLSCLESSTPQGRESHISERDSSSPGDTSLFHSDTGSMTFKMGPVCS